MAFDKPSRIHPHRIRPAFQFTVFNKHGSGHLTIDFDRRHSHVRAHRPTIFYWNWALLRCTSSSRVCALVYWSTLRRRNLLAGFQCDGYSIDPRHWRSKWKINPDGNGWSWHVWRNGVCEQVQRMVTGFPFPFCCSVGFLFGLESTWMERVAARRVQSCMNAL